jgi:chemotaxis response regulator CheB
MPKEAYKLGAVDDVVPLQDISKAIIGSIKGKRFQTVVS